MSKLVFWCLCGGMMAIAILFVAVPIGYENYQVYKNAGKAAAFNRPNRVLIFLLAIGLPAAAIALYLRWGAYPAAQAYQANRVSVAQVEQLKQHLGSMASITAKLEQRVKQHPDDAQGWYWLGRLYLGQQRFAAAQQVLATANQLHAHQPEYMLAYVQAMLLNQHTLPPAASSLIKEVLALQPQNPMALNLKALAAYQQGDYAQAVAAWEKLLVLLPPGSSDEQAVLTAIAKARRQLIKNAGLDKPI